jgi:hypothetical protein
LHRLYALLVAESGFRRFPSNALSTHPNLGLH